jgi:hypothetical protein
MGGGFVNPPITVGDRREDESMGLTNATSSDVKPVSSAPETRFANHWGYTLVALQLALILLIVRNYEIGSRLHFFPVLCVAAGGFLVHICLPARFRLGFFCVLSLAVVVFVLGWLDGTLVIALGSALIAVCYLPVTFALRVIIIVVAALMLAVYRFDLDRPFWAVFGSMFMFRMIVYLYELKCEKGRPPLGMTVAYFFPFQNVCFLFFPILDFKTFRGTYRADATWRDAQTGIGFLVAGLSHLLAYRVIKYYLLPSPSQIGDFPHFMLFLATNYALYLHVSGYFHIITGIFHSFGFGIPRTHHNYFLASSFTDVWRRINIPWKDFMATVFFFPAFFAARRWGNLVAVFVAAFWVFAMTWFLHCYQVFWITGGVPLRFSDALLWLIVGVLVAVNLYRDLARARQARPVSEASFRAALIHAARVVSMFVLVSYFWACWNTPEVLAVARTDKDWRWFADGSWVFAVLAGVVILGAVTKFTYDRLSRLGSFTLNVTPAGTAILHVVILAAVVVIGLPEAAREFGPVAARKIGELSRESVTPMEAARAVRGYYEDIADVQVRPGNLLAELEGRPPGIKGSDYREMSTPSDPIIERELIPNWSGDVDGARLTINRFGMRDRLDRTREKPPGVRRVAVMGSSMVMGWGVGDDEHFPLVLEDRLNARRGANDPRYEVLNFGTGLSGVVQRRALLERKMFSFEPDVLFWIVHQDEFVTAPRHLARVVEQGGELPYPYLRDVVQKAGITPDSPKGVAEVKLQPLAKDIVAGVYRDVVAECRRRGIRPVWVYLPMPGVTEVTVQSSDWIPLAEEAGFAVVNLEDWAAGIRPVEVRLRVSDPHSNALGHRIIGEKLDAILQQRPELLSPTGR